MIPYYEQISPVKFENELNQRIEELQNCLNKIKKTGNATDSVVIKARRHYNKVQFYEVSKDNPGKEKYIPRNMDKYAVSLIQQEYERKLTVILEEELKLSTKLAAFLQKNSVSTLLSATGIIKQKFIKPALLPDSVFAQKWLSKNYGKQQFHEENLIFQTQSGITVRSKSEVIIADTLLRLKIPFRYEFSVRLKDKSKIFTVCPDFYCLNLKTREEFIWEHFGLMENSEYATNVVRKIQLYAQNGYFPGKNLIITFESQENPLNSRQIERVIKNYLKYAGSASVNKNFSFKPARVLKGRRKASGALACPKTYRGYQALKSE